jgi:hypothetical protein
MLQVTGQRWKLLWEEGKVYARSIFAGLVCVAVVSLAMLGVIGKYLSSVYHLEMGPIGWNSGFFASPLGWLLTSALFAGGFFWEFRRSRSR